MTVFGQCILTTAYLPPVDWFRAAARSGRLIIEQHENFQKQSWRSRCLILTSQGTEALLVPVQRDGDKKIPIRDARIDYSEPWILKHRRALEAAYNSSAFFEYYKDDIFSILDRRYEFLFDLNLDLISLLLRMTGIRAEIEFTQEYVDEYPEGDLRKIIQPKYRGEALWDAKKEKTWFQVFPSGRDFVPGLSVIDLLCAEGPNSTEFLL